MKTLRIPPYAHWFEALDVGFIDRTAWLCGYVDFMEGALVIVDEFLLPRASTQTIADAIEAHERALWGNDKFAYGHQQPKVRVSDVEHRLIADLRQQHGLAFRAMEKKNFDSDINLTNILIEGKQLLVSESCVQLRRQLRSGVYNTTKRDMARDADGGHYDALAALRYLCRTADRQANPYPNGYRLPPRRDDVHVPQKPAVPTGLLPSTSFGQGLGKWMQKAGMFQRRSQGRFR